ncbi:MAG: hypothetical protein A3G33_05070 [Omnitrophica bacterium RIFCSPLOWO2_12_FULL_44_17]|uniref:Uncharacterized protein n=1 Tax=Candidatus Danuiimicrobium aquiferis TaxID=1801832 RepID=A0A1G1KX63_9BACT|nr:MAG: hypothetical protein A3B72_01440 [Omnitrophica bacterium RIFCSPHIGHO2_02_FULL_45_28]OGW89149.1 MAG: hypothetical protein A3E74_06235 [Omnitrophica bacterium RIFCSPHIGHO2_12_FULL_44_12]OGW97528.1 MAG: hypothetical protein A3G33_05070 [Omnitrophica bacterium RIFCSPLOWO2_12_FULL_44_17]OGX02081.1 MAG: hypothetical protein A3J12_06365 [Omnitrophica bacterium RIFCSPLOWO2_02_FULL_44_11]
MSSPRKRGSSRCGFPLEACGNDKRTQLSMVFLEVVNRQDDEKKLNYKPKLIGFFNRVDSIVEILWGNSDARFADIFMIRQKITMSHLKICRMIGFVRSAV